MFKKHEKKIIIFGAVIVVIIAILIFFSLQKGIQEGVVAGIRSFGFFAPVFFFLLQFAESIFPFFPGFILTVMGGYLFGPLVGALIAVLAVLTGSSIIFFAARKLEKSIFHNLPKKELKHFEKFVEKKGDFAILIARILPIFPNAVVCFSAGLTKISYWHFLLFSLIGLLPQQIILAFFGSSLEKFTKFSILFAAVFVLIILIFVLRHRIKRILVKEWVVVEKEVEKELKGIEKAL